MTLRGNSGRLVQQLNNLSGIVNLTEGPGIPIQPNNAKNSLQFSTVTATLEFDDILANGDSTARSAKFLNNASDTIPALIVHNTLDFGSGAVSPGVTLKYSPGTPDGLVIGPTTGTDKKILRTDIIGAHTSSAIVAKSGMTFDTGLTLTVDNLVAKSLSNNGNIIAHKLQPYDAAGLTIDLDNCTLTCADSVQYPQVIINPQLLLNGTLNCMAGASISGNIMVNNQITTPYVGSATDLQLNPSGGVRVIGNKTLYCNAISQNDTNTDLYLTAGGANQNFSLTASGTGVINMASKVGTVNNNNLIFAPNGTGQVQVLAGKTLTADTLTSTSAADLNIKSAMNQNINITTMGTGVVSLSSVVTPVISGLASGAVSINTRADCQAGIQTDTIRNNLTTNGITISTTGSNDISLNPGGKVLVAAGKTLTADTISSTTTNGNLALAANGTGTINFNSPAIGSTITATTFTAPASSNLNINAAGGSILTNAIRLAPATSLTIAPATSLTFNPGMPAQFNCSVGISNDLGVSGSLNSNGITNTATNGNLLFTPNGTGQVQIASGKTFATDIIKSNGATAIAVKTNTTFDASLTLTADNIVSKSISVNGNVTAAKLLPYDTAGLTIDLNNCTLTCTDAVANPQIIMSSPVLANILTVNTIRSADATNLTINSPGGTINTNATNITAPASSNLNINAAGGIILNTGTSLCGFTNGINIGGNLGTLGGIIRTLLPDGNLSLTTNGIGYVSIPNVGLRLPNGNTTLSFYGETSITGTWSFTGSGTYTYSLIRIGSQVSLFGPRIDFTAPGSPNLVNYNFQ